MAIIGSGKVYTNPRTESHLRQVLARLKQNDDAGDADVTAIDARVTIIESIFGLEEAVFDQTVTGIGTPLYTSSSDHVAKANASAMATANVVGFAFTAATAGNPGTFITHGIIQQANWTAVTGTTLLTPNARYYLSTTAGLLTTTSPDTAGQISLWLGQALSTIDMSFSLRTLVLL